ncbi:hypothetical protein U9M48_020808 [Paspalum notatum var. saurae]|uniref:Uncharacterized protein n=1 Tax=Paspalum notatum var. saurae TaxID=547442 RepID=A0AAQ3TFV8_PASNO
MAAAGTATVVSMKLFVDTKTQRVVAAVASTEVVDLLRSLLTSPREPLDFGAATVAGCIGNLYDSLDVLDAAARSRRSPPAAAAHQAAQAATTKRFYECSARQGAGCDGYVAEARGVGCPSCGGKMAMEVPLGSPGAGCSTGGAYTGGGGGGGAADWSAQGAAAGMVALMDDLMMMPLPTTSHPVVAILQNLLPTIFSCINHGATLREETVQVGFTQFSDSAPLDIQFISLKLQFEHEKLGM